MAKYFQITCYTNLVGTDDTFFVKVPDHWDFFEKDLENFAQDAAYDNASQYGDVVSYAEAEDLDEDNLIYEDEIGFSIHEVSELDVWEDVREDFTKNDVDFDV